MEPKELLSLLEERLVQHDKNREEVQAALGEICTKALGEADAAEERISSEIHGIFDKKEEEILGIVEQLNEGSAKGEELDALIARAHAELAKKVRCSIATYCPSTGYMNNYKLSSNTYSPQGKKDGGDEPTSPEALVARLQEHLEETLGVMAKVRAELTEMYAKRRRDVKDFSDGINEQLEKVFTKEDGRLQEVVKAMRDKLEGGTKEELESLSTKARTVLVVLQRYSLAKKSSESTLFDNYVLSVEQEKSLKYIGFAEKKPFNVVPKFAESGRIAFTFDLFAPQEVESLAPFALPLKATFAPQEKACGRPTSRMLTKSFALGSPADFSFSSMFTPGAAYSLRMRVESCGLFTQWSDSVDFVAPDFSKRCDWLEGSNYTNPAPQVVKNGRNYTYSIVLGNTSLPHDSIVSWDVNIIAASDDAAGIYIGVAPADINVNESDEVYKRCGWYVHCLDSTLYSGPPQRASKRDYARSGLTKKALRPGVTVGVEVNTATGDVSFSANGKSYGTAYTAIPLNRPLAPCVLLRNESDSVKITPAKVGPVSPAASVGAPGKPKVSGRSWDSITLKWGSVRGAELYQVEVDGSTLLSGTKENELTQHGLSAGAEHSFRVRAVKKGAVGEWSALVKGSTQKAPEFAGSCWKSCPEYINEKYKYAVSEDNPRVATMLGFGDCTIIGNVPIPLGKMTSWSVRVLKSKNGDNFGVWIGVLPFDVDQNDFDNCKKAGWHFYCYSSTLWSGPPHNYYNEIYRQDDEKKFRVLKGVVTVGVRFDAENYTISFAVNGKEMGAAFEGITLDRPLVPSAILKRRGDSVEFIA